ncbi:MAG: transcriptional regulator MntR [Firmicutes bacterium HGW-Firmicutes-12]|jgi:Mn-dependent DtxR family transcriptional regulator|nr:MAG: transcriptional regulator MntR [Firmicutes bacterium HGW-Firmicutes-12]
MVSKDREFYTVRGYALLHHDDKMLTPSMEDYLEMAYRLGKDKGYARTSDLAEALNVQPPSVSKMVQKLTELGYLRYEKYGLIEFTELGQETGDFLLGRHEIIERFLTLLGVTNNILEDTEKIEHNISGETYKQITFFVQFMQENQQWLEVFKKYNQ